MFIKILINEFGVKISEHKCNTCGVIFTLCPVEETGWEDCLSKNCESYDPDRDLDGKVDVNPMWQGFIERMN